jgi:hypothetical protein
MSTWHAFAVQNRAKHNVRKISFYQAMSLDRVENFAIKGNTEQWDPTDVELNKCTTGIPDDISAS